MTDLDNVTEKIRRRKKIVIKTGLLHSYMLATNDMISVVIEKHIIGKSKSYCMNGSSKAQYDFYII